MLSNTKNVLKASVVAASLAVLAGCASSGGTETNGQLDQAQSDAAEAKSIAQQALDRANQADQNAQAAMQAAQRNQQAMDRMFQRSMQK